MIYHPASLPFESVPIQDLFIGQNLFSIKSLTVFMVQCTSGKHCVSYLATVEGILDMNVVVSQG